MVKSKNNKHKILVVEDQEPNIMVATLLLEELGYPHTVARNSREALENFTMGGYSLVLMDIRMSGRDGIETARIIKSMEMHQGIKPVPIIALTADGDKERCLETGMDDYILKPVTLKILKQKLKNNLE